MRANIGGSGIIITFTEKDKETLISGGTIEGKFTDFMKPKIKVHICDAVERRDSDFLCEDGFRVKARPPGPPEKKESYEIWLSKENTSRLVTDGYWATRSEIDRIDMLYWDSNSNYV